MLIDDDVELADNTAALIRRYGHDVSVLYSTDGAIGKLVDQNPDLLILDVMFPGNPVGGFDLAREIRHTEAIRHLPVILLTSINQELPVNFSSRDIDPDWIPVQELLEKPVKMSVLKELVDRLLQPIHD